MTPIDPNLLDSFSEDSKRYIRMTQTPEPAVPERARSAKCTADTHVFVGPAGGDVADPVCLCGQWRMSEWYQERRR